MNNILTLRGNKFTQEKRRGSYGPAKLPKKATVELSKLKEIHQSLLKVRDFWKSNTIVDGVLISVYYNRITAKSNRISGYLSQKGLMSANDTIVGAKFNKSNTKHIITHYISKDTLEKTIRTSSEVIELFEKSFGSKQIDSTQFERKSFFNGLDYASFSITKTTFKSYLRDSCFVEKFGIEEANKGDISNAIITFYDIDTDIKDILNSINIDIMSTNILDHTTVLLDEKNVELVFSKIPYLVSMAVSDINELSPIEIEKTNGSKVSSKIPSPTNEPTIGVIDTLFETDVYFSEWVEYHDMISDQIHKRNEDYVHGTAVSSLIVDCPNLNPNLNDGCGHFKVRHFGVALHSGFSSFNIVKQIKEIVSQNTDIKVWNLSLGSKDEIKDNFISSEAAVLDEIQFKYDVIFVIAGTNASNNSPRKKIGSPADSLNSVVVNAVDFKNNPTDYSRQGTVLSFFIKPDIAYYGGNKKGYINVCEPLGLSRVAGTSFAAPLITRKLAYLIYIMGLNREEAKALLIDSAISWNDSMSFEEKTLMGYGVVPVKIEDILKVPDDEIKFIVSDISEKYNTYNYNFPVPISKNKYPYIAKATMCYFPKCSRNQGVDYTNTELDLHFGPLKPNGIYEVNYNKQNLDTTDGMPGYIEEKTARRQFRKWDNVKSIKEIFTSRKGGKEIRNKVNPQWGMSIKTVERLGKYDGKGIRFAVVVTLKELHGVNRIEEFINQSELRGWIVRKLQVERQVEIYNKLNEDVDFE